MPDIISFDQYKEEWLQEVLEGNPSTTEKGRRFAYKLISQWLDLDETADGIHNCDGCSDGGIDLACLVRTTNTEGQSEADIWYLIQSKYGSAFAGTDTLLIEGRKIIETLDGRREKLSSLSDNVLQLLTQFKRSASENDKIVLVFATVDPLNENEIRAMNDVRAMGTERLGSIFDVQSVSVHTVYQNVEDEAEQDDAITIPMTATLTTSGDGLLVGPVRLMSLYSFLKEYRTKTGDLDQLYEKNVRRFLGNRKKVNRGIAKTLEELPSKFGLYNNGITIVVEDFTCSNGNTILREPFIVNGCQTTRSIWDVFYRKLEAGGTGNDPDLERWKLNASQGVVLVKVVKVGKENAGLLEQITRYTNSQNGITDKDFLALNSDFRTWASDMAARYGIFLEIQRGAWDSQRAMQRQHPTTTQFSECANAFDLLKVYSAGWLREPGRAFGRNADFAPDGAVFKRIINNEDGDAPFGIHDLYAAFLLQKAANKRGFGRGAEQQSRRQTRFLYYFVVMDLLWDVLRHNELDFSRAGMTSGLLALFAAGNENAVERLLNLSLEVIDRYFNDGQKHCIFTEPSYQQTRDLNAFLKGDQLGKSSHYSPNLSSMLELCKWNMGDQPFGGGASPRDVISQALKSQSGSLVEEGV